MRPFKTNGTKIKLLSPPVPPKDEVTCPKKASVVPCSLVYFLNCFISKLNLRKGGEEKKVAPLPVKQVTHQVGVRSQLSSSENEINEGFPEIENVAVSPVPVVVVEEEMEQVLEDATNHSGISKEKPNELKLANQCRLKNLEYECKVLKEQIKAMRRKKKGNGEKEMTAQVHPYNCIYCHRGFNYPSTLIRHMCVHTRDKPYKCGKCRMSFDTKKALRNHEITIIHNPNPIFSCSNCPMVFATENRLKKHEALEHSSKQSFNPVHRPYACQFSIWSFFSEKDLQRHILTHTGERAFLCPKCGRKYKRKDNLKRHFLGRHDLTIEETNHLLMRLDKCSKGRKLRSGVWRK